MIVKLPIDVADKMTKDVTLIVDYKTIVLTTHRLATFCFLNSTGAFMNDHACDMGTINTE